MKAFFVAALLAALAARASAQVPGTGTEPVPETRSDAAAHADYDDAFAAMIAGDFPRAVVGFDGVAARSSDPELASAARELARLARELIARKVELRAPAGPGATAAITAETEERDEGRVSFIVWSSFYGTYAGVVAIDDFDVDDARAGIAMVAGGMAVGLFGSYYATDGRTMTGAMADSYSLGMIEGFVNAGLLVEPVGLTDSSEQVQTTLLLSGAVGGGAGLLYASNVRPTRGQISLAGTVSLLGFASTGLSFGLIQPKDLDGNTALVAMAAGTDVGLGAGLVLGRDLDWSVSRGRLVQLGAILGGLSGAAAGALITGANSDTDTDVRIMTGATLAGMWGGFAIAVRSTQNMRKDPRYGAAAPGAHVVPMPVRGGGGLAMMGSW